MTLDELYTELVNANTSGHLNLVPGVLSSGPIADFYQKLTANQPFIINGASIEKSPDGKTVSIKNGTASILGIVNFPIEMDFTEPSTFLVSELNGLLIGGTWAIAGVNWFSIGNPFIIVNASDTQTPVTGSIGGEINIGIPLKLAMDLPIILDEWVLNASFENNYPSISFFSQLIGGINISSVLPSPLNAFADVGVSEISLIYDAADTTISSIGITAQTNQPWLLLSNLTLNNLEIDIYVAYPGDSTQRDTNVQIIGYFNIGDKDPVTGEYPNTIKASAFYSPFAMGVQLIEGTIQLGDLLKMFLPSVQIDLKSEIDTLVMDIEPTSKEYTLSCHITNDWTFFTLQSPNLSFTMTGLGFEINSMQGTATGQINGTFHIGPDTPDSGVDLNIYAAYAAEAWVFGASTGTDQTISLGDIATTFLEAFGMGINTIPNWVTNNLPNISNVSFTDTLPDDKSKSSIYEVKGDVDWHLQYSTFDLKLSANVDITYTDGKTSGTITGIADARQMLGLTFIVGYKFGTADTEVYLKLPEFASTITYTSNAKNDIIDIKFDKISLGELISTFVGVFSPGFTLPAPWNLLNSIDLSGFEFTYTRYKDSVQSSIVATIPINVDLGFINIKGIKITKEDSVTGSGVYMYFDGTFLGLPIESDSPLQKDGKGSDATKMPPVPGMGSEFFDLKLLAMGQHVSMYDTPSLDSVDAAITALENAFTTSSDENSTDVPVPAPSSTTKPGTLVFDQNSNWLIGTDFTVAKFYRIAAVFNDPNMYGLLVGVNPAAKAFAGLQFEILYKKINDTIGMYQLDLQVPDAWRHLEFGEVSITLPIIGIKIYTNGNFYLDFGFPASITDFSRSFSIQVFPFVGYGGFYFGYLSGATSTSVPTTTCGVFNPVIEFGLGLSLGVGKTIDEGILKAGLSLTAVGIFQGVLGFFSANPSLNSHDETYYKIQGTFGLTGHIYGEINFAIISARLDIMAYAYITMVIESYMPIPITFEAGVSVKLTVKINLGLFSIKVSLHFSATIRASFTIGSDTSASAPWNLCPPKTVTKTSARKLTATMSAPGIMMAVNDTITLKWQPIKPATPVPLDLLFFPQLTVSGETGSSGPQYEAMLYIKTDAGDNSLSGLTEGVLYWAINALIGNSTDNTGLNWLQNQTITAAQISTLLCYFNTRPNHVAPFNYANAANDDIKTFFSNYFKLNISAVDATQSGSMDAAVFPVVPELILNTNLNGTAGNPVNFATNTPTGTQNYISDITALLASSSVDYQSGITAEYYDNNDCSNVVDPTYEEQPDLSFPTFMFTDFIALLAKQALQAALDYLNTQTGTSAKVSDVVNSAVAASVQSIAGMASRFMLHGLRLPPPPDASVGTTKPLYLLTGQQIAIPPLKKGDKYSVLLQNPNVSWINMVASTNNTLTITIDDNEIQHINDIAGTSFEPTLTQGPSALINYNDTPQTFSLGSPALWQYPGDYYTGISTEPVLWKLPSNLTTIFAENGNWLFDVKTLTTTESGSTKATVKNYTWSTIVNFSLQKITAVNGQITPLSNNMYNLVGADDAGTVYLQELLTYLNTNNDSDGTKTIQQIQILYQPDPTQNSAGGYVSDANGQFKTAIVQANLSTETNPVALMAMDFMSLSTPPVRDYNTLNSAGDFIKLLWECSIVRSGGFYFYYNNSENKGLPDTLFAGNGIANLTLVITYDNLITNPFVNGVVIGDAIDTSNTSVFVQSPDDAPAAQQYTTRVATLLPGNVGYQVSRQNPGDYMPTQPIPTPAENKVYLETQFNLINLLVPAIPAYINFTPAGPVDSMDEEAIANTKAGNATANNDAAYWNYNAVVPYYKYVQPAGTDPLYPNPYAGIGTNVQMVLNWQDMFGNVPPATTSPLNASMQLLYADAIIALSQWPSVSASYIFKLNVNTPNIYLNFNFNTVRYQGTGAQNNAQIDLITYMNIYYQLNSSDMVIHYTTTVEDKVVGDVNTPTEHTIANSDLLNNFINPIITYLKAIATGQQPAAVATYTINAPVTTTNLTSLPEISLVLTSLTMQRVANLDPNFANVAGVALANTVIQPLSENNVNSMLALTYFAEEFEAAFINQPNTGIVLKASTGANLTKGNSDTTATAPIWMVRFDTTGANGLKFDFNNQQMYYFAPIPLATSLQSFSAKISSYEQGKAFDMSTGVNKNFTSIDMDSWGQQFLQAVDKFLSPAYSVPAFLLTAENVFAGDPDYLQLILDAKQNLAEAIEGTIDFIIDPCNGQKTPPCAAKDPANIGNAQDKWKQQILIQLANAYRYVASVQTTASISSSYQGVNNEPPQAPFVPSLYGKMLGQDPSVAGSDIVPKSTEYSLSTAKVPTANGNSWLTYMFEAKDAAEGRSFSFGDMQYKVSHLEFDITQIPDLADYLASSWLTFIVPLDAEIGDKPSPLANMSDVGLTTIPIPLRAYPTPPSITAQNFDYPVNDTKQTKPITIAEARTWEYNYTYQNSSAAQDTIVTEIQFNVTTENQTHYANANTNNLPLYQALAQFISNYPLISADFDNSLALLTPATLNATSPLAINARYAMLAFIDLVNDVATQWKQTNQVNPRTPLLKSAPADTPVPPFTLAYTITESAQETTDYLIITIKPSDAQSDTADIKVTIDGYTNEAIAGNKHAYLYYQLDNSGEKVYLLYENRNIVVARTVVVNGLDILSAQNAWSSVAVIRNEELLQNADGSWQTTNPLFIYQTPLVMFYNKLIPLLNTNNTIDIAGIGTTTYPVQPTRTLNTQLLALFDALTQNINSAVTQYTIKMQCDYTYVIPGTTFPIDLPVLLVTPTELVVADHGTSIANMIATGINDWVANNNPLQNEGTYTFTLTAYSVTDSFVPVLQIPLTLSLSAIATS